MYKIEREKKQTNELARMKHIKLYACVYIIESTFNHFFLNFFT